jgi:hypothetical protein
MRILTDGGIVSEVELVILEGVAGYSVHGDPDEGFYPLDEVIAFLEDTAEARIEAALALADVGAESEKRGERVGPKFAECIAAILRGETP